MRRAGPMPGPALARQTNPVRFDPAGVRKMVAQLPEDRSISDSLNELANGIRRGGQSAVIAVVKRLQRYLVRDRGPAERQACWQLIARLGLLKDHPDIHHATGASMYRVMLRLAFERPLSYAGYCEIEDAIGGPPRGTLRSELIFRAPGSVQPDQTVQN